MGIMIQQRVRSRFARYRRGLGSIYVSSYPRRCMMAWRISTNHHSSNLLRISRQNPLTFKHPSVLEEESDSPHKISSGSFTPNCHRLLCYLPTNDSGDRPQIKLRLDLFVAGISATRLFQILHPTMRDWRVKGRFGRNTLSLDEISGVARFSNQRSLCRISLSPGPASAMLQ